MIKNVPYKGVYLEAFQQGYDYAYYGNGYRFGEKTEEEDLKHIPTDVKDKKKWLLAWHEGCAIGAEN